MAFLQENYSSGYLFISSRDRYSHTQKPSSFSVSLPVGNFGEFDSCVGVEICNVHMINTFYNVDTFNNEFVWYERKISNQTDLRYSVTIPIGNYDIDSLLAAIQKEQRLGTSELEVVLPTKHTSEIPHRTLKWEKRTGGDITTHAPIMYLTLGHGFEDKEDKDKTSGGIGTLLGFNNFGLNVINPIIGEYKTAASGNHWNTVAPSLPSLNHRSLVHINSPQLAQNTAMSVTGDISTICSVPLYAKQWEPIFYEPSDSNHTLVEFNSSRSLTALDFSLTDQFGREMSTNGSDWSITIKIYYVY